MTRASVLIPTHDKHATIGLAVDSVLRQTVGDLEVILIGDGVTDALRAEIGRLCTADPRVRFLDLPKGPHHGERYRHDAILAAESDAIFYLCDDDLFLPDHVADLLGLLEEHTFVQCLNGFCRADGEVELFAGDLAVPDHVAAILDESLRFNSVSVTGTAHSRAFYLEVGDRWDTTPDGQWPDHHQWRKLLRHPAYRGATSTRMTALQLPTSDGGRDSWTPQARYAELQGWADLVAAPDGQARVDELVARAALRMVAEGQVELARVRHQVATLASRLAAADLEIESLQGHLERVAAAHGEAAAQVNRARRRRARAKAKLASKNATIARLRDRLRSSPVE